MTKEEKDNVQTQILFYHLDLCCLKNDLTHLYLSYKRDKVKLLRPLYDLTKRILELVRSENLFLLHSKLSVHCKVEFKEIIKALQGPKYISLIEYLLELCQFISNCLLIKLETLH